MEVFFFLIRNWLRVTYLGLAVNYNWVNGPLALEPEVDGLAGGSILFFLSVCNCVVLCF